MNNIISGYGVQLKTLTSDQLEMVRSWRNHPEVSRFMFDQQTISPEQQQAWFRKISHDEQCAHYVIYYRQQEMGLIYIHSADNTPLSQSKIIEPGMYLTYTSPYRGTLLAFSPALTMIDYCFDTLRCNHLIARVKHDNQPALRFNQQLGYKEVGREAGVIKLKLNPDTYQPERQRISRFLRF
jgi:RimJ/RimL family protein N-acetyltransferase